MAPCSIQSHAQQWAFDLRGSVVGTIRNVLTGTCVTASLQDQPPATVDDIHLVSRVSLQPCSQALCSQLFDVLTPTPSDAHTHAPLAFASPPHPTRQLSPPFVHDKRSSPRHPQLQVGDSPSLLCWVMAHPESLATKALAVNQTWGSRCTALLFVVSEHHHIPQEIQALSTLPLLQLRLGRAEGRLTLWHKSKLAWRAIATKYGNRYDWILRADDDSFIVLNNLARLLAPLDPAQPQYFGRTYQSSFGPFYSGDRARGRERKGGREGGREMWGLREARRMRGGLHAPQTRTHTHMHKHAYVHTAIPQEVEEWH